jgi:hypothetical protein
LFQEIRRREKVIRIIPHMGSTYRLVGALCAETCEEWSTGRWYLNMGEYFGWKTDHATEPVLSGEITLNGTPAAQSATVPA